MKYRIGFKNGMVITIDAEAIIATAFDRIDFKKGNDTDYERYVNSSEVLFVAPADHSHVQHLAVAPAVKPSK